jgi:hypothetical protein
MALKAYKHLTDGEVKIVNEGSAEETSLLADTVTGSSYLQLTSTGHSQEVAAAQGTALWVDVTSDSEAAEVAVSRPAWTTKSSRSRSPVCHLVIPRLPTAKMFIGGLGSSERLAPRQRDTRCPFIAVRTTACDRTRGTERT